VGRYTKGKYESYASDCLHGQKASCICACPFNLDIRAFIGKIKIKSFSAAYRIYRNQVVFPEIVSRLCTAPCREACVLKDKSIDLLNLEKACVGAMRDKSPIRYNLPRKPQKAAIIGAGLSGLACAQKLASKNYDVTVYEKADSIGGRVLELMSPEEFIAAIETEFKYSEYKLHTSTQVTDINDIQCDALYISTGKGGEDFGLAEGMHTPSLSTIKQGVFLGGALIGASDMEAIMQGAIAASSIETYLQTGKMGGVEETFHQSECALRVSMRGKAEETVVPSNSGQGYTAEEAVAEAGRCLLCDCTACRDNCELIQSAGKMPKRLVDDAIVSLFPVAGLEGQRIATRTIASCQQCGACAQSCPKDIDMELFYRDFRRLLVNDKTFPAAFHDYFIRDMEFSGSEDYYLALDAPDGKKSGYAFFPGCQLGGSNPDYVLKAYRFLLDKLPGTALMLACCGIPAEWAGEQQMLDAHTAKLRADWERLGKPAMILACPTCQKAFKRFLPDIESVSLYEMLESNGLPEVRAAEEKQAAVYDPCASRYFPAAQRSVRSLASKAGYKLAEIESSAENAKCCSYGGHTHMANPGLVDSVTKKRISESDAPYITYCANCRDTFAAAGKDTLHILDVVFGLEPSRERPNRSKSRLNRRALRPMLLNAFWGEHMDMPKDPGAALKMSEELKEKLSASFILEEDILTTIKKSEASGRVIKDASTCALIAHMEIGALTYWAVYTALEDGTYLLHSAYTHRMKIEE
jgi:Fe-S oxidoreductase